MEKQVSRRNKRYKAHRLFLTKKYTARQISAMVGVTEATMSKWVKVWKNPDTAGIKSTTANGIISPAFVYYLQGANPALLMLIHNEIKSFLGIPNNKPKSVTPQQIEELKTLYKSEGLTEIEFYNTGFDDIENLSYDRANELLWLLKEHTVSEV